MIKIHSISIFWPR